MRFARSFARFYSSGSNIEHRTKALQILSAAAKELKSNEKGCILGWSAKLLGSVDRASHGIDLLGRDSYLLGCLLCTMGNFMESCAGTMDALYLGAAVIKLVLSDSVVANMKREAFVGVLRSGRAAAARAISSVPAASIATSVANDMLPGGRHERGAALSSLSSSSPSSASLQVSNEFVSLLFKAKTMFEGMAKDDRADKTVKALSQGGLNYIQLLIIDALEEHARSEQLEDALQRTEVIVALDPDAGDAGGGSPGPSRIRIPSQTNTILL